MFHLRSNSRSRHSLGLSRRVWLLAIVLLVAVPRLAFAADEGPKSWHANLNLKQLFDAGGVVGVILAVVAARDREKFRTILPVFGGWWMGWTSATIARYVYPPPKSRPSWAGDRRS